MPSYMDPAVAEATKALKESQKRLTDLRRQHLETAFVSAAEVTELVAQIAGQVSAVLLDAPAALRRALPDLLPIEAEDRVYNAFRDHVSAKITAAIEKLKATVAGAPVSKNVPYTVKPGPRPARAGPKGKPGPKPGSGKPKDG
jgi:phage terminase Nu1 subunit (DNA packaging protein)